MFIEIKPSINTFTVYTFFSTNPRINLLNDSLFSAKNIAPVFLININAVITLYFGKINQPLNRRALTQRVWKVIVPFIVIQRSGCSKVG